MRVLANPSRITRGIALLGPWCLGCGGPAPLTVDMPLHLEDHLDAATVVGSEVPAEVPSAVEWRFDEPQPDWTSARLPPFGRPVQTRTADALRLSVEEAHRLPFGNLLGGAFYVEIPDLTREVFL